MEFQKLNIEDLRVQISTARTKFRMTQQEAAEIIGCNRKWVSNFERGLAGSNLELVMAYARLFDIEFFVSVPADDVDLARKSRRK